MNYTSHNNNLFVNYGLACVVVYMKEIENKKVSIESIGFDEILKTARYFYENFTTLKSFDNPNAVSNKKNSIVFHYMNVNKFRGQSSGKKAQHRYLPANVLCTDKEESNLMNIGDTIKDKTKISEGKKIKLTISCFPFAGKYLFGEKTYQTNVDITSEEFLCYLITTTTPWKPSFLLENTPTSIIPDFSVEDLVVWVKSFKEVFDHFNNKGSGIDYILKEGNKHSNPTLYGNYKISHNKSKNFLKELYLISDMKTILSKKKRISEEFGELLKRNEDNFVFYTISRNVCFVHKYTNHIVKISQTEKLGEILDSVYNSFINHYRKYVNGSDDDRKNKILLWERDFYNFASRMDDPSLQKLNSKRIDYNEDIKHLFDYYYKNIKKMNQKTINSAYEIAQLIRRRYRGKIYTEQKDQFDDKKKLDIKVDLEMNNYINEFSSYLDKRTSPSDFVTFVHRFCRDMKMATVSIKEMDFINAVLTNEIDLQDAKSLLTSMLRINVFTPKKEEETKLKTTQEEEEVDA